MTKPLKRIAITGANGKIAYNLIFSIAQGNLLGPDQPIALHLLDLPEGMAALKGVVMELEDCVFPLLKEIKIGSNPEEVFEGVHYALLVGAKPRGPGMERKDLLTVNGQIFVGQAKALNRVADKQVKVLVVGNPCNTNCLIAMHHAPDIPKSHFYAMTRLDQNRAVFQLAKKAGVDVEAVTNVTIWGNHSSTQMPDFLNAKIAGKPAVSVITDRKWLETEFVETIQKRGAAVIGARGSSSAASAAHAIVGAIRSLLHPKEVNGWFSSGIYSQHNPYGIREDLIFSFPCHLNAQGETEIVKGLQIDAYLQQKIELTQKELIEERDLAAHLLKGT